MDTGDIFQHNPGLAVVGDLSSDDAQLHWLVLFMFLCLPLGISLFLVLTDLGLFAS